LFCLSCSENGVKLAKPSTFVRYFNGGTPDISQSIIKTSSTIDSSSPIGGYLILANSQTALTSTYYRIKLIRVDEYGNEFWTSLLPEPPVYDPNLTVQKTVPSYRGLGITPLTDNSGTDNGYFIVGEEIYVDPNTNVRTEGLLMIQVDTKGALVKTATITPNDIYTLIGTSALVRGVGVTRAKNGNFYVSGEVQNSSGGDLFLTEIDANSLTMVWARIFAGAASSNLVNRVFTYGDSIYWGGTRAAGASLEMRWIGTQINSSSKSDIPYPNGQVVKGGSLVSYNCNDICKYGFGYGFVGSYGLSQGVFSGIAFFRVNENGQQIDSASYTLPYTQQNPYQAGNSICSTLDGGFLILGTAATDISTSDTNYILIKTDAHGVMQWKKEYGGRFIDVGAKVLQADDGGFIVLGTTTFANVESVFLMKTGSDGGIQ